MAIRSDPVRRITLNMHNLTWKEFLDEIPVVFHVHNIVNASGMKMEDSHERSICVERTGMKHMVIYVVKPCLWSTRESREEYWCLVDIAKGMINMKLLTPPVSDSE